MRSLAGVELAGADLLDPSQNDFVLDAAGTLTQGDAALLATALEKDRLMWFDEPTSVLTNDGLARVAEESVTPIGLGRSVTDIATFQNLLRWGASICCGPAWGSTASRRSSAWRRSPKLITWRWRRITMAAPSPRRPAPPWPV
jgi:L-alanine-DL-glutamate epimerase-like enolase superfamily enzyme